MQGYIGEIKGFGGNFAPRSWAFCDGQVIAISSNTALFSIIGTIYGGDGRTTFKLPDLRGRVAIHQGRHPGGYNHILGSVGGQEEVTLNILEMPQHNHTATVQASSASLTGSATATMYVNNSASDGSDPNNMFLGQEGGGSGLYATNKDANSTLNPGAIHVDTSGMGVNLGSLQVAIGFTGGSQPHENMPPYQTISWIICLTGIFPSRN